MSAATAAVLTARITAVISRRIGVLFMIGSACFAVASIPGLSDLVPGAVGVTYFVGSIFFTSAAFEQMHSTQPGDRREALAGLIQFAGTLFFNVSTFAGMLDALGDELKHEQLIWNPDAYGSVCFLVASLFALAAARGQGPGERRMAFVNLVGSIAFGFAAIAAYVVPDTGDLLDASLANSMTLIGAVCFFVAAWWLYRQDNRSVRGFVRADKGIRAPNL